MQAAQMATIAPMTGYEPGIKNRRTIVLELHRRALAEEKPPSLRDLGRLLALSYMTVSEHLDILEKAGMIERRDGKPYLTDCGALTAEFLEIGG